MNPVSGKGIGVKKLQLVHKKLESEGFDFHDYITQADVAADQLIKNNFDSSVYTDMLIIGGDGTINQAFNGLKNNKFPVGLISAGTGNDTVRSLLKTLNVDKQIAMALHGKAIEMDAGECNGRIFLNGLGIGFDGRVVEAMMNHTRQSTNHPDYFKTVLKLLSGYRESPLRITIDTMDIDSEIFLLTVAKGKTFGGGFKLNPYANRNDGLLDICMIEKVSVMKRFFVLPTMSVGGHKYLREVRFYKCQECVIEKNNRLVAHLDGEFIGYPPFHLKVLPRAIRIKRI